MLIYYILIAFIIHVFYTHYNIKKYKKANYEKHQEIIGSLQELSNKQDRLNEKLEKRIQKIEKIKLTKDQVKFKEELDKQYEDYYVATKEQLAEKLSKQNDNFEKRLADEYEKACKSIKFNEIEYKKTITKKRKDYNAKNGKFAKPERKWRYIDEE